MTSARQDSSTQPSRSSRRGRAGSAADDADRAACGFGTASCSGPIRPRRSARICSGAASPTGSRRRPMAASPGKPSGCSTVGQGAMRKTRRPARAAPPDQAGLGTGAEWKGRSYRVMVMADGFAYDGKTFTNLSEIASEITGTHWNGPRFFGLRSAIRAGGVPMASEPKVAPLRHLHPQIHRAWPGTGVQLAGRPAGGLRGLYQEPGLAGLEGPAPALRRPRLFRRQSRPPCPEAALDRHRRRQDRRHRGLQDRPPDPLAGRLRQTGRGL